MSTPAMAANPAPTTMPISRRSGAEATMPLSAMAAVTPVNAPTLIKPAWPRLSSPSTPTVRFRLTAMTT